MLSLLLHRNSTRGSFSAAVGNGECKTTAMSPYSTALKSTGLSCTWSRPRLRVTLCCPHCHLESTDH